MNSKFRKILRRRFTLIELIVAMAVFSIMITILADLFIRSQKLWSKTENKNEMYADARAAMDLFATTLQSQYFDSGHTVFMFGTSSGKTESLFFPVKMPTDFGRDEEMYMYYLSFIWDPSDATLYWRSYGENNNKENFRALFALATTSSQLNDKASKLRSTSYLGLKKAKDSDSDNDQLSQKVITGVMNLQFLPIYANPGGTSSVTFMTSASDSMNVNGENKTIATPPYGVMIQMQMLSKQAFAQWKTLGGELDSSGIKSGEPDAAKEYRLANTHQFDRIVYLGFQD